MYIPRGKIPNNEQFGKNLGYANVKQSRKVINVGIRKSLSGTVGVRAVGYATMMHRPLLAIRLSYY